MEVEEVEVLSEDLKSPKQPHSRACVWSWEDSFTRAGAFGK